MKLLETERLILRPWELTDVPDYPEYAQNDLVGPDACWKPIQSKDKMRSFMV